MALIKIQRFFGAVPNDLLNNPDISFKAKGLYAYLNSKPDDWDFSIESISSQVKEGIDSVRAGIHELEKHNYLKRIKRQNEKGFWEIDYMLFENPMEEEPYLGKSNEGEHPKQHKKENTKKENTKKEEDSTSNGQIQLLVDRINQIAGTAFRATNKETSGLINARLKEYSVEDLLLVVEHKSAWLKDIKMKEYYRPSTLFRPTHFENYLNAAKQGTLSEGSHKNNPDFKLGAKRYRPLEEFATYRQYAENCTKYGHTPQQQNAL
jgi:uncharacterized phage protein (TIGR02220 family)